MNINIGLDQLLQKLETIRTDGRQIFSHPLGFYRLFITAKDALSPGFLLHAWLEDTPRQSKTIDIHSHTWDLTSRVIAGELTNQIFRLKEDARGTYVVVNVAHDGVQATRYATDERVTPVLDYEETVSAGQTYGFPSKKFHCTVINKYPTITLLQKRNMISDTPVNIIPFEHSHSELGNYDPPILDQNHLWDKILGVIKEISLRQDQDLLSPRT